MAMTMRRTRHKLEPLEPQCDQSCTQGTVQQTRTTPTTKKRPYKQTSSAVVQSTALTSLQLVFSWVSTCFRFAATLNMLLCLSLCIRVITSLVSPVREFLADFVNSHTAKTGLLRCCLYRLAGAQTERAPACKSLLPSLLALAGTNRCSTTAKKSASVSRA